MIPFAVKAGHPLPISPEWGTAAPAPKIQPDLLVALPVNEAMQFLRPYRYDGWGGDDPWGVQLWIDDFPAKAGTMIPSALVGKNLGFTYQGDLLAVANPQEIFAPRVDENDSDVWMLTVPSQRYERVAPDNRGHSLRRVMAMPDAKDRTGRLERALFDCWQEENEEVPGLNDGNGTLQGLIRQDAGLGGITFLATGHKMKPQVDPPTPWLLTNRERRIAATVIQWLGTNCGRGFLYKVERRAGIKFEI